MENHHAINGQINYKWQYPIALLNYQRVILNDWESKMLLKAMLVPAGNQTMVEGQGTSNIDDILGV